MKMTRDIIAAVVIMVQLLGPVSAWAGDNESDNGARAVKTESVNQRALTGVGESAGAAAGQTIGDKGGFLSTGLIVGTLAFGVVLAVALESATDNDRVDDGGTTTTTTTTTATTTTTSSVN